MELGKTITDKLKSKVGIGNDGKLLSRKNKKKKDKKENDSEEVSELRNRLREKWYSRMGLEYEQKTLN